MGSSVKGARQGGSRPKGVAGVLHCSKPGSLALWVRDVGVNGAYGEGPGQFSVQGRKEDHGETAVATEGRELDIPAVGGSNEGYGNGGEKDINSPEAEYGRAIYCNAADSGPVQKGHPAARRAGVLAVVGTDGDIPEGSAREGGGSSDRNGNRRGFGVRGRSGRGRGRKRGRGGVPRSERVQWSRVEWSGAGRRMTEPQLLSGKDQLRVQTRSKI